MSGIEVAVKSPTNAGRLYPKYDGESGILAVGSRIERPWPFGVDIDGRMVFDLDSQKRLANFDLHIPRNRWIKDLEEDISIVAIPGDLEFSQDTISRKSFNLALRARTDQTMRRLSIEIGSAKPDRVIALSNSCVAFIAKHELVGFKITGW